MERPVIVRIKRKRTEAPLDSIILEQHRESNIENSISDQLSSVLKLNNDNTDGQLSKVHPDRQRPQLDKSISKRRRFSRIETVDASVFQGADAVAAASHLLDLVRQTHTEYATSSVNKDAPCFNVPPSSSSTPSDLSSALPTTSTTTSFPPFPSAALSYLAPQSRPLMKRRYIPRRRRRRSEDQAKSGCFAVGQSSFCSQLRDWRTSREGRREERREERGEEREEEGD
mmetsp:Transcript_16582/g.30007  ORF Transcript_16582/g.30007 Transcript_16582/m.30007 type:complete len:228 (+) Transcript_16582:38-721(+)